MEAVHKLISGKVSAQGRTGTPQPLVGSPLGPSGPRGGPRGYSDGNLLSAPSSVGRVVASIGVPKKPGMLKRWPRGKSLGASYKALFETADAETTAFRCHACRLPRLVADPINPGAVSRPQSRHSQLSGTMPSRFFLLVISAEAAETSRRLPSAP
jgi:hypothetical protein